MSKNTVFYSQWNEYEPIIDKTMNRERAANLIRAWRRNSRKKSNSPPWIFKRIAPHTYFVKICEWDRESNTLHIVKGQNHDQ